MTVHVRFQSLYISMPYPGKRQHEMTTFGLFWRTKTATTYISNFAMELIAGITYLVSVGF